MADSSWMNRAEEMAAQVTQQRKSQFQLQGGDWMRDYAGGQLNGVQDRQAPTSQMYQIGARTQIDAAQQQQARGQMQALADQYQRTASGQQAGAGELAVNRQRDAAAAQQFAAANMSRGANAGIAARVASRQLGDLGTNAAGMASQSALADQAAARGQLSGLLGSMRGQDMQFASDQAQLNQQHLLQQGQYGQQTNLANQAAMLQQRGRNDQYGLGLQGQLLGLSDAELRARVAAYQADAAKPKDPGFVGGLMQMGGQALAAYAGRPPAA